MDRIVEKTGSLKKKSVRGPRKLSQKPTSSSVVDSKLEQAMKQLVNFFRSLNEKPRLVRLGGNQFLVVSDLRH